MRSASYPNVEDQLAAQTSVSDINRPLKIAFCMPFLLTPGSTDTSILQQMLIASGLVARGNQVRYIAPANLTDMICTEDPEQTRIVHRTWSDTSWFRLASSATWKLQQLLGIPYLNYFSNLRFYDAYLRCLPGQDILHERNGLYRVAVAKAAKRLRLPYILFFDGDDILEQGFQGIKLPGILRKRAEQIIHYNLRAADRVICVSELAKRRLQSVWHTPAEKVEVFPNGVDTQLYRPNAQKAARDRAAHGLDRVTVIIFVGSFYPWQDTQTLLEAFASVLREDPQSILIMVGDGQKYKETIQKAEDLGISPSVRFTGFLPQDEVANLVNSADIAIAPYIKMDPAQFIISPMKLFEYLSGGRAVIASDLGQMADVITHGVNGLLVEPGNPHEMADAMLSLIRDPSLRQKLGIQARKDAIEKFSWEGYVKRLEEVYRQVIEGKKSGARNPSQRDHGGS